METHIILRIIIGQEVRIFQIDQFLNIYSTAHSPDADGIFEYEVNNKYVNWFSPKWKCNDNSVGPRGGDAIDINISNDAKLNGAWCDADKYMLKKFICEASI